MKDKTKHEKPVESRRMAAGLRYTVMLLLAATLLCGNAAAVSAKTPAKIKILFIGNSLTRPGNNPMIKYFKKLAKAGGHNVEVSSFAISGEKLDHYADPEDELGVQVRKVIASKAWNYVVLQDHTNRSIIGGPEMTDAIVTLSKLAKKRNKKTKVLLMCTWAYYYTRRVRGDYYKYGEQRKLMKAHYKDALEAVRTKVFKNKKESADIAWSGSAFAYYMKQAGHVDLYKPDLNHPSHAGAYLNACCIYAKIMNESPVGNTYVGDIKPKVAKKLQKAAYKYNKGWCPPEKKAAAKTTEKTAEKTTDEKTSETPAAKKTEAVFG